MQFFVGTLTRLGGPGLVSCRLEGNVLKQESTGASLIDPSYLIFDKAQRRLYAVSANAEEGGMMGSVTAWRLTESGLVFLGRQSTGGNGACYLTLCPGGQFLYAANYATGSLAAFPVTEEGIGPRLQLISHHGRGPHPTRQAGPHVHQVTFLPWARILCAVDLGTDELVLYAQDTKTGLLSPYDAFGFAPGLGPRHVAYGRDGTAYVAHELGNAVSVLKWVSGKFALLQTLSTLPEGFAGENTAAAIRLSPDGATLYVSNRGHDSIAGFRVEEDGRLVSLGFFPSGGKGPRDFILLADGRILAANQHTGVALLSSAPDRRVLSSLPIPGAVCVCLVC